MTTLQRPRSHPQFRRSVKATVAFPTGIADPDRPPVSAAGQIARFPLQAAYRGQLIAAYGLLIAEYLLRLAQPLTIGLAINDLLGSSFRGLLLFAVGYLVLTVTAAAGAMFQTRVFAAVYAEAVIRARTGDDCVCAAVQSPAEMMTRLEQTVPETLHRIVAIGGALLMLGWYELTLVPFGLLLFVPFWLLRAACGLRMSACVCEQRLTQADIEAADDVRLLQRHLQLLRGCRVRMTDTVAIRTALRELFVLGLLASAIVHFLSRGTAPPPAGDIFAVVCYLLVFVAGLRDTPVLMSDTSGVLPG